MASRMCIAKSGPAARPPGRIKSSYIGGGLSRSIQSFTEEGETNARNGERSRPNNRSYTKAWQVEAAALVSPGINERK